MPFSNANSDCIRDPALGKPSFLQPPNDDLAGQPFNYLHTCGRLIYDARGHQVMVTGLNWFGMETSTFAPDGLWTRNWQQVLDQIVNLGYNTVRLPYSNEFLDGTGTPAINYEVNSDLQGLRGVTLLDRLIDGAGRRGLKVLLDRHRPTSVGQSALWYTDEVSEQKWIDDWVMLAQHYLHNDTVIGFDLHNEPRDNATWGSGDPATDWRLAAERAGNAILAANPYLLIFVQGTSSFNGDYYWWGGHLGGVANYPARLNVPNRLVYSPHDYGPEVYQQGWFNDPSFPRNLPAVWDAHWGYLERQNIAPVVVGEFGGRSVGADPEGVWQRALLSYMQRNHVGFFNWSLNPNSGDTGGLLTDDWLGVVKEKQNVYRSYLAPPIIAGVGERFGPPPESMHVLYRAMGVDSPTANIAFSLQVLNDGSEPLDLRHLELRYWFHAGSTRGKPQVVEIDYAAIGKDHIEADVVATGFTGQDSFLRLRFDSGTPPIVPYQTSGEIMVRVHKVDWSPYVQTQAFSFRSQGNWIEWDHIGLYSDDRLVWGIEPPLEGVGNR